MRWLQRLMGRTEFAESPSFTVATELPEIVGAFVFEVERVVEIAGRGTVAIGTVQQGTARVGDEVTVRSRVATIAGIEAQGRALTATRRGEPMGLVLGGVTPDQVVRGDTVSGAAPSPN